MRYDYNTIKTCPVTVRGVSCEFTDDRVQRDSVPSNKFLYEVGDGSSDGEPARIAPAIWVDFFGSLVSKEPLPLGEDDTLWLGENDWVWVIDEITK